MSETASIGRFLDPSPRRGEHRTARGARVRRLLLEQVRYALTTEPAALDAQPDLIADSAVCVRGRVSITLGAIAVRLNQEGFTESDRLYAMRDGLAQGKAVERCEVEWLNAVIARERSRTTQTS